MQTETTSSTNLLGLTIIDGQSPCSARNVCLELLLYKSLTARNYKIDSDDEKNFALLNFLQSTTNQIVGNI